MPVTAHYSPRKIAFIGLGVMGYPMAGHLSNSGHYVSVFNRHSARAEQWCSQFHGKHAASPAEAAHEAELVMLCVGRDEDVREVITSEHGIAAGIGPDAVVVDHTTTSAALAREIADYLRARHAHYIDAPVSGGEQGAINGHLTILCGGEQTVFKRAEPVLGSYACAVTYLGETGSGQLTKMVNQICIAGLLQGLAEGIHFGQQAGLDMPKVIDAIGQGAAQSWQMQNRALTMLEDRYDFGFAVDWMHKDLGYCLAEAEKMHTNLPVAQLVEEFYTRLRALGGGRLDTSSLLRALQQTSA